MTAYIKHMAGACWITHDEVIIMLEGFTAPTAKKIASPVRVRLADISYIERVADSSNLTKGLRIITPLHKPRSTDDGAGVSAA